MAGNTRHHERPEGSRFGEDCPAAGSAETIKDGSPGPFLLALLREEAGFLVIPYQKDDLPVYLKVRPPCDKEEAERRGLVRFLNTAAAVPCLYNVDALNGEPDKALICEGESDTWTALSYRFAAVGTPGARNFKAAWVEGSRTSRRGWSVNGHLVLDADKAGGRDPDHRGPVSKGRASGPRSWRSRTERTCQNT